MIQEYENLLRTIVISVIGGNDDSDYKVSNERIEKWKEKREIEFKKYKDSLTENRLIYYSDFYDLENIITKNWDNFSMIFKDKKQFQVFFKCISTYRNTIAHGRNLLSFQESLINGILGETKTNLIKYHNQNMNVDDFFIRILKVHDNLGNISTKGDLYTDCILKVGDELELHVEAYDPKGREITYNLQDNIVGGNLIETNKTGFFKFQIVKSMINKNAFFRITVKTEENEYENICSINTRYILLP